MKKIALTSLMAVFAVAGAANASGFYATGYLATSVDDGVDVFDLTSLNLTVGYAFNNSVRLEADIMTVAAATNTDPAFAVGTNQADWGIHAVKVMYDFKTDSKFTPYVGGGIAELGYLSTKAADAFTVTGMFTAGVMYAVTPKINLDLQYNRNFTGTFAFNKDDADSDSVGWGTWKAGVMYKF